MDKAETFLPLCHRCEHRVSVLEGGTPPRYECGDMFCMDGSHKAVCSCYMYSPVRPLVIKRNEGDKRQVFAPWLLSARVHAIAIADGHIAFLKRKVGAAFYFVPNEIKALTQTTKHKMKKKTKGKGCK